MSQRELFLLSPYRMPAQNSLALANEDTAAFLNGYSALWHPAVALGAAGPPKIASPYDYEQPTAGHIYAVPDNPPMILPEDWDQRVIDAGAVAFRSTPERDWTLSNLKAALETSNLRDTEAERFACMMALLDLPREPLAMFFAIGFGYLMVDTLFEAMEHENLLASSDLWRDVQDAIFTLGGPIDATQKHLQNAADRLMAGREILYPVAIYLLDLALLDEAKLADPLPGSFAKDVPLNLIGPVALLEKLSREHPERFAALREKVQAEKVEICSGPYQESEDTLLPVESQLWNLIKGVNVYKDLFGTEMRVFGRKRFGAHPQLPGWLNNVGLNRGVLLQFDASVLPNFRAPVTNWPSPDGKQIEALTRTPYAADSPQTFFHLAHYLQRTIRGDQAATLSLVHTGQPASPLYDDWMELNRFGPILGKWATLSSYFSEAMCGEYASAATADDFHSDYLEERTNAKSTQPVSEFARHTRLRRQIDTTWSLAAIYRGLAGKNDQLNMDARLNELEDELETGANPEAELAEAQKQVADALAGRLLSRATSDKPGYLVLNPCSFTRRITLELDDAGPVTVEGPVKACQVDEGKARLVVEVPALGFAWFAKSGPPGSPRKMTLADKNGVRNEFFEADVDPATGGLKGIRDHRTRINRLGQQLVYNPGSVMRVGEIKVTSTGPALGEVVSTGAIYDEQDKVLARFRQRFRAWLGRPILDMRIELIPEVPAVGYPWHSYFGARFAWRDERGTLLRGVNGTGYISTHTRPETPDYVEVRLGGQSTTLFMGGLPFHQRHSSRMLDVILMPEGETVRSFDLGVGLDRDHPTQTALGMMTPVPVVATTKGPPHVGSAGWLFHLDASNLLLTGMRPAPEGADGVILRLLETSVHGGAAEFRCVRNPNKAMFLDARGGHLQETSVNADAVSFEVSPCDLVQLRVDFS
ncbi:MAG: hypothetical protein K2R98_17975 [Gemmataceae bacterium]|nr:hypothetical protein [Gemmataceae bacterium]